MQLGGIRSEIENRLLEEVKYGLGVEEFPDGIEVELPFFEKVWGLFSEASCGCYFCDDRIDPNSTEFGVDTFVCITCQLKLANFMTACGLDPSSLLPFACKPRVIQKTKFYVKPLMKLNEFNEAMFFKSDFIS